MPIETPTSTAQGFASSFPVVLQQFKDWISLDPTLVAAGEQWAVDHWFEDLTVPLNSTNIMQRLMLTAPGYSANEAAHYQLIMMREYHRDKWVIQVTTQDSNDPSALPCNQAGQSPAYELMSTGYGVNYWFYANANTAIIAVGRGSTNAVLVFGRPISFIDSAICNNTRMLVGKSATCGSLPANKSWNWYECDRFPYDYTFLDTNGNWVQKTLNDDMDGLYPRTSATPHRMSLSPYVTDNNTEVFVPIPIFLRDDATSVSFGVSNDIIFGQVPFMYWVQSQGLFFGDTLTIGSETWDVFDSNHAPEYNFAIRRG